MWTREGGEVERGGVQVEYSWSTGVVQMEEGCSRAEVGVLPEVVLSDAGLCPMEQPSAHL